MLIGPGPQNHPFWTSQCPARGPGLKHTQNGLFTDPCADCGESIEGNAVIQRRLSELDQVGIPLDGHLPLPTITGLCARCQQPVAQHPARVDQVAPPMIREPALAKGEYRIWTKAVRGGYDYAEGPVNGPGRGLLSPAWVEWALNAHWADS